MSNEYESKILELGNESSGVTPTDLAREGIPRRYLYKLHREGLLERAARGLYYSVIFEPTEHWTMVEVARRVPDGVICLLSALQFHGLTTQMPHKVWLAIQPTKRRPREPNLPIRLVHFSGESFSAGVEEHDLEGAGVRIYSLAKTVADCFKFRNKIGLDVALEALRDYRTQGKYTNDDLYRFAKICRVWNVMRPYMEAMS